MQQAGAQEIVRIMNALAPEFAEGAKSLGIKATGGILGPRGWIVSENLNCPAYPKDELERLLGRKYGYKHLFVMVYTDGTWSFVTWDYSSSPKRVPLPRLFYYMPEENDWRQKLTQKMHELAKAKS